LSGIEKEWPNSHVEAIIEKKILMFSVQEYSIILKYFPTLLVGYILSNVNEFIKAVTDKLISNYPLEELLAQDELNLVDKATLICKYPASVKIEESYSDNVKSLIVLNKLDTSNFGAAVQHYDSLNAKAKDFLCLWSGQNGNAYNAIVGKTCDFGESFITDFIMNTKIQLRLRNDIAVRYFDYIKRNKISECIRTIGLADIAKMLDSRNRVPVNNTPQNEEFLELLNKYGYISSYEIDSTGTYFINIKKIRNNKKNQD
jgi:hypothetical protein